MVKQKEERADKQQKNSKKKMDHLKPYNFKPGQSGNPKGRPKGKTMSEALREALMKPEVLDSILVAWINKAERGDMNAIKEMLDRTEGKVKERIDHTTNDKDINNDSVDKVKSILDSLSKRIK